MNTLQVLEFETRILFPFFFKYDAIEQLITHLLGLEADGHELWRLGDLPAEYADNIIPYLTLFRQSSSVENNGAYLSVNPTMVDALVTPFGQSKGWPLLGIAKQRGIELFLSPYGSGVLSISVTNLTKQIPTLDQIKHIVHSLHLGHHWTIRHDARCVDIESPVRFNTAAPTIRSIPNLCEALMRLAVPWTELGKDFGIRAFQRSFAMSTVVRFNSEADFGKRAIRQQLLSTLIGLQSVWPPTHCGTVAASISRDATLLLNRRHWVCVGHLGACHLVSDQEDTGNETPRFNKQRTRYAADKAFLQFLYPLTQRLALQTLLAEATDECKWLGSTLEASNSINHDSAASDRQSAQLLRDYSRLRLAHQHFSLRALAPQLSEEDNSSRVYLYCRRILSVDEASIRLERLLNEMDRQFQMQKSIVISAATHASIEAQNTLRNKVEWIEVFIVTVYAVELAHIFGNAFAPEDHVPHNWLYPGLSLASVALVTMTCIMNAVGLFEHRHTVAGESNTEPSSRKNAHTGEFTADSSNPIESVLELALQLLKQMTDKLVGGKRRWALIYIFAVIFFHILTGILLSKHH